MDGKFNFSAFWLHIFRVFTTRITLVCRHLQYYFVKNETITHYRSVTQCSVARIDYFFFHIPFYDFFCYLYFFFRFSYTQKTANILYLFVRQSCVSYDKYYTHQVFHRAGKCCTISLLACVYTPNDNNSHNKSVCGGLSYVIIIIIITVVFYVVGLYDAAGYLSVGTDYLHETWKVFLKR